LHLSRGVSLDSFTAMKGSIFVLFHLASAQRVPSDYQKDTYSMSHPFAWKAFMEEYFPTAENLVQENSTSTCVEWVKLCIDDGNMAACSGPAGNFQLHSVGAYARDSGAKSMEQIETEFSQAMGDMKTYDPYFEYNMGFLTENIDHYIQAFDNGGVPYFASTWTDQLTQKEYKSVLVQTPGSLAPGAKSLVNIQLLAASSSLLEQREVYRHSIPRASSAALGAAHARLEAAPRKLSADSKPVLVRVHRSFASSDLSRDSEYFQNALQGSKDYETTTAEGKVFGGKMQSIDTVEIRFVQSTSGTRGPVSVAAWESYQVSLHNNCFDSANNDGFDRLADNHGGHPIATKELDPYIKAQKAAGLPYRFYGGGMAMYFYMYGPNGWGIQIIGSCTDSSLCPSSAGNYDMCTQGITGHCSKDGSSKVLV